MTIKPVNPPNVLLRMPSEVLLQWLNRAPKRPASNAFRSAAPTFTRVNH